MTTGGEGVELKVKLLTTDWSVGSGSVMTDTSTHRRVYVDADGGKERKEGPAEKTRAAAVTGKSQTGLFMSEAPREAASG